MLEAPDIPPDAIASVLRDRYAIDGETVAFLPIGNDPRSFVYRADGADGTLHFVKLRAGALHAPGLLVPRALRDAGIGEVVAPIRARSGELGVPLGGFTLIVYEYVHGDTAMNVGLTDAQWRAHGRTLARVHATRLADDLVEQLPHETYVPASFEFLRDLHPRVLAGDVVREAGDDAPAFWRAHADTIARLLERTRTFGAALGARGLPNVLVHCDIHTANVMVDRAGALHYVDWDAPMMAPRERDLKFMVDASFCGPSTPGHEAAFLSGYGIDYVDPLALAYYRHDWVIEDLAAYGNDVFRRQDIGAITRADSFDRLQRMFVARGTIDVALRSG
jgi:spectinomycin phosphotransferase